MRQVIICDLDVAGMATLAVLIVPSRLAVGLARCALGVGQEIEKTRKCATCASLRGLIAPRLDEDSLAILSVGAEEVDVTCVLGEGEREAADAGHAPHVDA